MNEQRKVQAIVSGAKPDRSLPLRRADLIAALARHPALCENGQAKIAALARRITKLFHLDYFSRREALKDLYVELNPDQPGRGPLNVENSHYEDFIRELRVALEGANFNEVDREEIHRAEQSMGRIRARVRVPWELYDDVHFFVRGRRIRKIRWTSLYGFRKHEAESVVFDQVVIIGRVRADLTAKERKRVDLRPGAVYLKLFRDIPEADLNTLFPYGKVLMTLFDKLMLGIPALLGGIPAILKLIPAISIVVVIVSAYMGVKGRIEQNLLKQVIAAGSGIAAVVGFVMGQWIKFERRTLQYQKQVAQNAYFKTLINNATFFDFIIGASEEAEVKELMLAYFFLLAAAGPVPMEELDRRIEAWIEEEFHVRVDFDVEDALAKLEAHALCSHDAEGYRSVPIDIAIQRAARTWARLADEEWFAAEIALTLEVDGDAPNAAS